MSDPRTKRIAKEIADVKKDKASSIIVEPFVADNLLHLKGTFQGPDGTPYEGGVFEVDIQVPDRYPFMPLKMKFLTKVYHPNISSASGAICLDILKDAWTPVLTLRSTLVSLQSLLCSPEPKDPQDAEVAKHYLKDRKSFESTARYWTEIYAKPQAVETSDKTDGKTGFSSAAIDEIKVHGLNPEQVSSFVNMGFDKTQVIEVMRNLNYRGANAASIGENAVVEKLLGA